MLCVGEFPTDDNMSVNPNFPTVTIASDSFSMFAHVAEASVLLHAVLWDHQFPLQGSGRAPDSLCVSRRGLHLGLPFPVCPKWRCPETLEVRCHPPLARLRPVTTGF
jgi:hypothetical protein